MRTLAEIVPLRTAACKEAVDAIAQVAAGETDVGSRAGAHVRSCLRCQAEVAAYRRVLRTMAALREDWIDPPPGTLEELLEALHGSPPSPWAIRAAYVGGLTAAGAAGVLVWFSRRRPAGLPSAV